MTNIILLFLVTLLSWSLGDLIIGRSREGGLTEPERSVLGTGIGFGVLAYIVFLTGQLGLLYSWILVPILLIMALLLYKRMAACLVMLISALKSVKLSALTAFEKALLLVLVLAFIFSLAGALAPPVGNDALAYHLYHPKVFIETHSIGYIPYTRESLWPYLIEMLFTLGMLIKGTVLATLLHYVFGVLGSLAVFCFAKRFIGGKTGLLAAALFYLSPGIFMQASYAYIDLALCFYVFSSFYLFVLWDERQRPQYLVLSGLFSGLALSVKAIAVFGMVPLVLLLVYRLIKERMFFRKAVVSVVLFIMPAILFSFIWYLRSFLITGNPVYPFLYSFFGRGWEGYDLGSYMGHVKGVVGFLRLPWDLVMNVKSFGGEQIGFLFLALLPCLVFVKWQDKVNRYLAFFTAIYAAIWFKTDSNIRFLFPVFPAIFLLYASGLDELLFRKDFKFLKGIMCAALFFNLLLAGYYNIEPMKLLIGKIDREKYLMDNERTYGTAKWANANLEKDAAIISVNEPRMFYFEAPGINYTFFRAIHRDEKDAAKAIRDIKEKHNHMYLVVNKGYDYVNNRDGIIDLLINKKEPIFSTSATEEGRAYSYTIYKIK